MPEQPGANRRGWRAHAMPVLLLILLPVFASILLITGIFNNNPALFFSFLGVHVSGAILPGAPGWLDPTVGLITQPLGRLSAEDWLHGIIPWWNPYTGVGMPLAAEMQPLSFFLPFVLLLKFWQGWLYLKIILQIISGLAMYALLIELGCRRIAAFVPGVLYALNGTFFLVPHAMGPIPFLPLLLLGVERAGRAAVARQPLGWGLIPLALAYSLYAGYPETAFLDGLLVAVWTIWRFIVLADARGIFAAKVATGAVIGIGLSLPLIVPFLHYVQISFLSAHRWMDSFMWLGRDAGVLQILPLFYGPLGMAAPVTAASGFYIDWAELGGWFGLPAILLGFVAVTRPRRHRGLIYLLFGFILFWEARIFGMPGLAWLADLIPGVAPTNAVRFIWPAMEAAVFIMAGVAIDIWLRDGAVPGRALIGASLLTLAALAISLWPGLPALRIWHQRSPGFLWFSVLGDLWLIIAAICVLALLAHVPTRRNAIILAAIIGADAFAIAFLPQLSAPRTGHLDLAGVAFLKHHQGLARSYTLQPFGPNYPAGYGIASINDNALPVAKSWRAYINAWLDPYADVVLFSGMEARFHPGEPDQTVELRRHLPAYGETGVKYVLAKPGDDPFRRTIQLPVSTIVTRAMTLSAGQSVSGLISPRTVRLHKIGVVEVLIGTYDGAARGMLNLSICVGTDCATGHASLDHAADDEYLSVRLDHALTLSPDAPIRYRISHQSGSAVALWLGMLDPSAPASLSIAPGRLALPLKFAEPALQAGIHRVFQDQVMSIYRLPHYRRIFTTSPACTLVPVNWNRVAADCPHPATLTRLEAWFPGWHVRINGKPARIGKTGMIFQSVPLPAGRTDIEFFYRPRGTRFSVGIACLALLIWLGLMARAMLLNRQLHRHP